jgi:hypothetical protein
MRRSWLLLALALLGCPRQTWAPPDGGVPAPVQPLAAGSIRFVVYGDTRGGAETHAQVLDAIARLDPSLVLHSGDLWAGYPGGAGQWRWMVEHNANLGRLLAGGLFVVARGNHEAPEEYQAFAPSLSHGSGAERFSFVHGPAFFVVLGMDPAPAVDFLRQELSKPEAAQASWRFVASHFPIYSGGLHGGQGNAAIEALCDEHQVAIYFSGHDHLYERSQQIRGQALADSGDALAAGRGTVYLVTGGGGAPLYPSERIASTHANASVNNFVEVVASARTLRVTAYTPGEEVIDTFSIGAPPLTPPRPVIHPAKPAPRRRVPGGPPIRHPAASAFLKKYCAPCHAAGGPDDRAFAVFQLDGHRQWREDETVVAAVVNRWHLDGKIMPPPQARAQPSDDERRALLEWIARGSPNH